MKTKKFIRLPVVMEKTGLGRTWIHHLIKKNSFPAPVKIGERTIAFIESEIDAWMDEKINASRNQAA